MVKSFFKKFLYELFIALLVALIIAALGGSIYLFSKKLWDWLAVNLMLPTPLWVTIFLSGVVVLVLIRLKIKTKKPIEIPTDQFLEKTDRFKKKFFVLWDEDLKPRCNFCTSLLKPYSGDDDPSRFFCSNPQCNSKYILKDNNNKKVTYQEALDSFKAEKTLAASGIALSAVANTILELYKTKDETVLNLNKYIGALQFNKIEAESAIDELRNKGIIISHTSYGEYGLTAAGKKLLTNKLSKNQG